MREKIVLWSKAIFSLNAYYFDALNENNSFNIYFLSLFLIQTILWYGFLYMIRSHCKNRFLYAIFHCIEKIEKNNNILSKRKMTQIYTSIHTYRKKFATITMRAAHFHTYSQFGQVPSSKFKCRHTDILVMKRHAADYPLNCILSRQP